MGHLIKQGFLREWNLLRERWAKFEASEGQYFE